MINTIIQDLYLGFCQASGINAVGLGVLVLLEDISGVLVKVLSVVVDLNKATHIWGLQLNS